MSLIDSEVRDWIRENAVPLKSVTAGVGFDDLAPLREWVGSARVVGLGEATHDTREFFQLKHRMFEFLVAELGFTLFTIEAPFSESLAINHYVLTGEGDARHSLTSTRVYCWDTEEVLELIEWMRRWNATHERKVFFYGYDMQSTAPATIFLLEYLRRHDPKAYRLLRDALQPLAIDTQPLDWRSRSETENVAARNAIAEVVATLAAANAATAEERHELAIARLHAAVLSQSERARRDGTLQTAWRVRDASMAENISALLDLCGPDTKAVAWAHNAHVQLKSSGQFDSSATMGQHLREKFGKGYVVFKLAFDHGSFGALDDTLRMREWTVPSVPGTLDASLAEAGPAVFALDLRAVPTGVAAWFAQGLASRSVSGMYTPAMDDSMWTRCNEREFFDALLFVRETSAARHNPAAPYQSEFVREDSGEFGEFANLDFGAGVASWRPHAQSAVGAYQVGVVSDEGKNCLEVIRSEPLWPYDVFALVQTASAAPWHGGRITVRCAVNMEAAHDGSSAQLALRVLQKRGAPAKTHDLSKNRGSRNIWQRVATCDAPLRELSLTAEVDESADTIQLALVITGDGRARFGPITLEGQR